MSKSQRKHLKLQEKAEILEALRHGTAPILLSRKYGVAKSTMTSIKNKRHEILKSINSMFIGTGKRKTLKISSNPKMEKTLYKWFLKQREQHAPINGDMLKDKAKTLHKKFHTGSFYASNGWLQRFKKRYGIRFLKIAGEKLSAQPELIAPFKEKIAELQLSLEQIYNADESGLYWKLLPDKTYVSSLEKTAPGRKTEKQRVTFLACTNASGSYKVKLLVIGKAKNPRSFKNFNNCPVNYDYSKTAWMTSDIFKHWFKHKFIPEVKEFLENRSLPIRALLLLDNAPSHPPAEEFSNIDKCITVLYMPPNVTPLIQPMDQNVIRLTKLFYRKNLLTGVLTKNDVGTALKDVTLRDAVLKLNLAWKKLNPTVIRKCWHNVLPQNDFDEEDNIPLSVLKLRLIYEDPEYAQAEIINFLNIVNPNAACDRNDVKVWNEDRQPEKEQDEEIFEIEEEDSDVTEDPIVTNPLISTSAALQSMNIVIQWAEENTNEVEYSSVVVLQDLRAKLVQNMNNIQTKQTKLTDFFQPTE